MSMNFSEYVKEANNQFKQMQSNPPEHISEKDADRAFYYMKHIQLLNDSDLYLYFASINLLNRYIKQEKDKDVGLGYGFKLFINVGLRRIVYNNFKNVKLNFSKNDDNNLLLIDIEGMQFSFHSVSAEKEILNSSNIADVKWDQIKKQVCALSVFNSAKDNPLRSNKSIVDDGNLDICVEELLSKVENSLTYQRR